MMSWFPLFFPLKQPVWFPDESECVVNLWRREDGRKVWYEWMVEAWIRVADGKKMVKVGGSEVHSSEKEGCLM
jgi:type II protein arginine methyltransferase